MHFRLYGDSWCYHWLQPTQVKSKEVASLVNNDVDALALSHAIFRQDCPVPTCCNLYKILFEGLGHNLTNAGVPGVQFQEVVDNHIINLDLEPVDINIVFVSSMFRNADELNKYPPEAYESVDMLNKHFVQAQENIIQRLREHAEKTKQHFFLIGGHQPLHSNADMNTGEYVHVLYFDLLMEEINMDIDPKTIKVPSWFRMSTDIDWRKINLEKWGGDVIGKVGNDMQEAQSGLMNWQETDERDSECTKTPMLMHLLWPDNGHPGPNVMFNVTNKILHLAEKLTNP
tara:strand:- start:4499 stop:5356 length:858 start_codon:yes stop_codon:yes gene_type:complete